MRVGVVAVVAGVSVSMVTMVVRRESARDGPFRPGEPGVQGRPCEASLGDQARRAGACRSSHITARAIQSMRAG